MKYSILLFSFFLMFATIANAQNVGIDTENPDAKLDVVSSNSGILIPRIALTGTNDVATVPAATTSELVYNTATAGSGSNAVTPGFYYWNGSLWVRIKVGSEGEDDDWYENGNTAPDDINDNIFTYGRVGIGNSLPKQALDVSGNVRVGDDTIFGGVRPDQNLNIITNGGIQIMMDDDNGGSERFGILHNGVNSQYIFDVDEDGNVTADGDLILETGGGNVIEMQGSTPVIRSVITSDDRLDIEGTGGIRIKMDTDDDNPSSQFSIVDGVGNILMVIDEDQLLTLYPNTNAGSTGGVRLRELTDSDAVTIKAPDALSGGYSLVLPTTDGGANQVLETDGSGVLSWSTPATGVNSVTAGVAITNSGTAADPILDVTTDNQTIAATGIGGTLEVIGLPAGDDDYIQNQDAVAQSGAKFRVEGDGTVSDFNITGGDIYGPGINYGSTNPMRVHSNSDVRMVLDEDGNGNESFQVHRNGSNNIADRVFEVFENGVVETDGSYGMLEGGASPQYYTYLESADLTGANLTFTLPVNAGNAGEILETNGSGILSWTDGSGLEDHDFYEVGGSSAPDNINDDIYTEGMVGIGTTTPDYTLDVDGNIGMGTSSAGTLFRNTDNNTAIKFTDDRIQMWAGSSTSGAGMIDMQASVSEVAINENSLNWNFRVEGGSDVSLLFTDGANNLVGIGTNTPNQKLEVAGNARITDLAGTGSRLVLSDVDGDLLNLTNGSDNDVLLINSGNVAWGNPSVLEDDDWHEVGTSSAPDDINDNIFTFGKVGIGINTPGAPLEVQANGTGNPFANSIYAYNANAEAANRDAIITARTQRNNTVGDQGGDPFFVADAVLDGGWSFGMDNDHENRFKLSNDPTDLSTATKMTVRTDGHVGIGTSDPTLQLHLSFAGRNGVLIDGDGTGDPIIQLENNFGSSHYIYSDQSDGNGFEFESANDIVFNTNGDNERMVIESGGDVGIGLTNALAKLDVNGNIALNDSQLRLRNGGDGNHYIAYVGGSIDGPQIQGNKHTVIRSATRDLAWFIDYNTSNNDWPGVYAGSAYAGGQTGGSFGEAVRMVRGRNGDGTLEFMNNGWGRVGGSNGLAFWANGNADGDDAPAMVLLGNGRLGIGTTNPTRALVEINGSVSAGLSYGYLNSGGGTGTGSGTNNYSLYASNRIAASEFNAHSDARIKNIKGVSDREEDLGTIMDIEITDYDMVDKIKDQGEYKRVIAQQVEKVYPQAVKQITDVVPDIFKLTSIQNGWVSVQTDLLPGERVKLIFDDDHEEVFEVVSADASGFQIDSDRSGQAFVYGREVDDFRVVDYESISMLNVSATQQQQELIEAQKTEIERLKKENKELRSLSSGQEARLQAIEAKLGMGLNAQK